VPLLEATLAQPPGGKPTAAQFFSQQPSATPMLFSTSVPYTNDSTPRPTPIQVTTASVYSDQLDPNWSLEAGPGMLVDQKDTTHAHDGTVSLAMTPKTDFSKLSFYVSKDSSVVYPRDQVTAIRFWLNSGSDTLQLSDLIVKVLGSNIHPYYAADDNSVPVDSDIFLQETRLYFLGLKNPIPAEKWVEVTVTLDKLTHDPNYKYVTGFYIKNDAGFLRTVYIDDIHVEMIDNGGTVTPTVMPEPSQTPAPTISDGLTPTILPEPSETPAPTISAGLTPTAKVGGLPRLTSIPQK
jgi:hypothetical protein